MKPIKRNLTNYPSLLSEAQRKIEEGRKDKQNEKRHKETSKKIEALLKEIDSLRKESKNQKVVKKINQGSHRQIGLAFYYMQDTGLFPKTSGYYVKDAKFIEFLTGFPSSEIRKKIRNPANLVRAEKNGETSINILISELETIKDHFERIGFMSGVNEIERDIKKLKKDQQDIIDSK